MKKYSYYIFGYVRTFYTTFIEAHDQDEAEEKFKEMVYGGDLDPDDNELKIIKVDEYELAEEE